MRKNKWWLKGGRGSAEPREKRIAELELKTKDLFQSLLDLEKLYQDEKKENTELKEQHKVDLRQIQAILNQRSIQNTKLTQAKEIIREIMKYDIPTLDYEKAEQFLEKVK